MTFDTEVTVISEKYISSKNKIIENEIMHKKWNETETCQNSNSCGTIQFEITLQVVEKTANQYIGT